MTIVDGIVRHYQVVWKKIPPLDKFDFTGWDLKSQSGRYKKRGVVYKGQYAHLKGRQDNYYYLYNRTTRKKGPELDYWWIMLQIKHYQYDNNSWGAKLLQKIVKKLSDNDEVLKGTVRHKYKGKKFTMNMFRDFLRRNKTWEYIALNYYNSPHGTCVIPVWVCSHDLWKKN